MRGRIPSREAVWVAVVAAGVLAVVGFVVLRQLPLTGGPLRDSPPHGWSTTQPVGQAFTDGLEILKFPGAEDPAVLESVELIDADGLEIVGVSLAGPKRKVGSIMVMDGYPPVDPELADVRPSDTPMTHNDWGWELLLGLRATRPGRVSRNGLRITYSIGGRKYARDVPAYLTVCTSRKHWRRGDCPLPKG